MALTALKAACGNQSHLPRKTRVHVVKKRKGRGKGKTGGREGKERRERKGKGRRKERKEDRSKRKEGEKGRGGGKKVFYRQACMQWGVAPLTHTHPPHTHTPKTKNI